MNSNYYFLNNRFGSLFNLEGVQKSEVEKSQLSDILQFKWLASVFLFLSLLISQNGLAQVSAYGFSQSTGTFTAPTTGLVGTAGTASTSPASIFTTGWDDNAATMTLPFTFKFNGTNYTQVTVSSNGFMVFGSSISSNGAGAAYVSASDASGVYLNGTSSNNGVAGFNLDQQIRTGATFTATRTSGSNILTAVSSVAGLRVGMRIDGTGVTSGAIITAVGTNTVTLSLTSSTTGTGATYTPRTGIYASVSGTAPSRIYTITTVGSRRYSNTTDNFDFQYVLTETANTISLVFGQMTASATANNVPVGIRSTTADFNSRLTATDWSATSASTANTDKCVFSSTIFPASGLTFTWTPPALTPCVAPTAIASAATFSSVTTTSLSGSYTAASPAPSKYLVVRSTSATAPTPANGTAYTVGSTALGAGTNVVLAGNALTFSDSGLTAGTLYYYYVFSYNDNCTGEPFYSATALSSSQATLCSTGTALASNTITSNSANITWTGSGNYIVEYGLSGFTPGTGATAGVGGTIASSSATSPYALTGLSGGTNYVVYVRQVCALGGYSANASSTSFTTACSTFSAPTTVEPFASAVPPTVCWTRSNGLLAASTTLTTSTTWNSDDYANVITPVNKAARINIYGTSVKDWLISPSYNIGTSGAYQLEFDLALTAYAATTSATLGTDDKFAVVISTDNGVTWSNANVLQQWTSSNTIPNGSGTHITISLASYTGTVKIGFYGESTVSNADNDLYVDNVILSAIPVLPPNCASGLVPASAATGVVRNSSLSWAAATGGPLSYDVYFGTSTNPSLVTNTTGLSYTPPTMAANTTYYWKIVPKNANGDAIGCAEQTFTTGTSIVYCTSLPTSNDASGITNIVLGATSFTIPDVMYQNNNATPVSFTQNDNANVQITFATGYSYDTHIWIDFNDDGDFLDSGEKVYTGVSTSTNPTTLNASFVMLLTAPVGLHQMRIGTADSGQATPDPCYSGTFGVTLDFIVNVLAMPTDTPDWVNLQWPYSDSILAGNSTTVYAQVYEGGLTDTTSGQAPGIQAWIGISPVGSNTNPNTWTTWIPATFNLEVGNNDEYMASIGSALPVGTYYYASRFRLNGGPYVYGGTNDYFWNGTGNDSGVLTVNANPTQCANIVAPVNAATNVVKGSVALSWTAPTSGPAPTGYKVYFGTTSGSLTLMTTTTSLTYSATAPAYSTVYYWKVIPTSTIGGDAVGCAESSFTTEADPFAPYCSGITFTSDVEPITLVTFAGINNSSSAVVNGTPSHQNFISITGNVTTENSYTMTLKGNTAGDYTNYFRVFVDWNHDGDFADVGESFDGGSIVNSTGSDAVQAVSTIAVPGTALAGATRMRIKKIYSFSVPTSWDSCTGGTFGQMEDYTLNVTLCTPLNWYVDNDGDTYGDTATLVSACNSPGATYVLVGGDCNDSNPAIYQSALLYTDADNDGYDAGSAVTCYGATLPAGTSLSTLGSDCNDADATMHATYTFYTDADGDGYGSVAATASVLCAVNATTPPAGYSVNNTDCDDTKATTHPGAVDVCYDGIDNDCNGNIDNVGLPGGCTPINTVVQGTQCGTTLATIDQYVYANLVANAQGYRFKVTDLTTSQVQTIDKALRVFQLTQLGTYAFNRTYQVEVSVRINNVWQPYYGSPCTVTTPATTTSLQSAQCGSTLTAMGDVIYANNVPFAAGYRFRVVNLLTSQVQTIDRPIRDFRMTLLATAPEFNSTYTVEVAVKNTDGTYLPYGSSCNITTPSFPTTQIQTAQCDYTAVSASETFYADSNASATMYRFKFENTGLGYVYTIDRPTRSFVLSTVPGLLPATPYSVSVSIQIGGVFGPYGKICTLTTSGAARPVTVEATPERVITEFKATAYPNPFAENFKLDVNTSSEEVMQVRVYDMLGKLVEERQVKTTDLETLTVGDRYSSGVYNVIVTQGENTQTVRVIKR